MPALPFEAKLGDSMRQLLKKLLSSSYSSRVKNEVFAPGSGFAQSGIRGTGEKSDLTFEDQFDALIPDCGCFL
ncbi:MAG: hypothetical protein EZS28_002784 [Streblomastix strix]|uniref:Uncharacterized protein n=1 Tax=Streblomastix strix TaxID=222440 RepID=A0A5J4X5A6_9EUKA|nr:MAG: hypothetical protein EZS28_002784 [Streblomastix strix]